ncbi:hypothetical protein [Rhizobium sp. NLR22b]|uniref:hypothetical protein n=1 Tax=Rhizobium sp. NLR22b TaxID=2731115 RepID=UPI001C837444|nr:hypothetical protein [Rhizobium sp. NLR22b]MBX5239188.1 hypothetical protein [Rhizobium sp. NLR22b]
MTFALIYGGKFGSYLVADTLGTKRVAPRKIVRGQPDALTTGMALGSESTRVQYTEDVLKMCNFGTMAFAFAGDGAAAEDVIGVLGKHLGGRDAKDFTDAALMKVQEDAYTAARSRYVSSLGLVANGRGYDRWNWKVHQGPPIITSDNDDLAIGSGAQSALAMLEYARKVTPQNSEQISECAFFCDRFLASQIAGERHNTWDVGIGGVATAIHATDSGLYWAPDRTTYVFATNEDYSEPLRPLLIYKTAYINGAVVSLSLTVETDDMALIVRTNSASMFDSDRDIPSLSLNSPVVSVCILRGSKVSSARIWQKTYRQPGPLWDDDIRIERFSNKRDFQVYMSYVTRPDFNEKMEHLINHENVLAY